MEDLNILRDNVHANAVEKGFWDTPLSDKHYLMLVITELSEAIEADRKNKRADISRFMYESNLLQPKQISEWQYHFNITIHNSIEDELADAFIRTLDLAGSKGTDLVIDPFAVEEMEKFCIGKTFTEIIYTIVIALHLISDKVDLNRVLHAIFGLAKYMKIDLFWHIEQKMKYNQSREKMHGKRY